MALRLYGQKLPPLSEKTRVISRGYSDDDRTYYIDECGEDEPLLSRNGNERKNCDLLSTIKDIYSLPLTAYKQAANDTSSTIYPSDGGSIPSLCEVPAADIEYGKELLYVTATSPCVQSADVGYHESDSLNSLAILMACNGNDESTVKKPDAETFELSITNAPQEDQLLKKLQRSISSREDLKHMYVHESDNSITRKHQVHDSDNSLTHEHQQRLWKHKYHRSAMSRSQSQPLATDEKEYSKYWRGEVTVVEMRQSEIPQLKSEHTLDDKIAASAVTRSILMGNNRLVLECIKQGENPLLTCTKTGRSYLHIVTNTATLDRETRWVPIVYQLSNAGVDVNAKDFDGLTPVRIAIKRRLVQILAALLKCGAEYSAADEYYAEQVTGIIKSDMMDVIRRLTPSYWSAIDNFTYSKINRLIKAWSRVNISRNGQTLIEYAKQQAEDPAVVKLLVHNEASIELAHAVIAGDADRVKVILCDSAADLSTVDTSVKTNCSPLTLFEAAARYEHENILKVLKEVSKHKSPMFRWAEHQADSCRVRMTDSAGSSPSLRYVSADKSTDDLNRDTYSGSSKSLDDAQTVTSALCSIL